MCFSSSLGRWIDHAPNRLKTLLLTITVNRLSVITACLIWPFIVRCSDVDLRERSLSSGSCKGAWRHFLFLVVVILGVLEKLSGSGNMISMERDWVVVLAAPDSQAYDLTRLNSVMRRIDLTCKLVAPILISVIISATSFQIGVFVVGAMSAASWGVEWWCARRVWNHNPSLRRPKPRPSFIYTSTESCPSRDSLEDTWSGCLGLLTTKRLLRGYVHDFGSYFSSNIWIPSFALSMLHISVLAYSATFITYLLTVGFSLNLITIARAVGSIVEISSTIVAPLGVDYLGKAYHHIQDIDDSDEGDFHHEPREVQGSTETGLERLGLWGITWQLLSLVCSRYNNESISTLYCRSYLPVPDTCYPCFVGAWIAQLDRFSPTLLPYICIQLTLDFPDVFTTCSFYLPLSIPPRSLGI
jgi:solute carrier family 40 (iron-regulated transporter), member 1